MRTKQDIPACPRESSNQSQREIGHAASEPEAGLYLWGERGGPVYGVALGGFHPESQGRHLSFEVTGRKRDKWDEGDWCRWRSNWGKR